MSGAIGAVVLLIKRQMNCFKSTSIASDVAFCALRRWEIPTAGTFSNFDSTSRIFPASPLATNTCVLSRVSWSRTKKSVYFCTPSVAMSRPNIKT